MTTRIVLLSALLLTMTGMCWAATVSYDTTVDAQSATWAQQVSLPAFDPTRGSLVAVELTISGEVNGAASLECLDAESQSIETTLAADIALLAGDGSRICSVRPEASRTVSLGSDDGSSDFDGQSGSVIEIASPSCGDGVTLTSGLSGFIGSGQVSIPCVSMGESSTAGCGNIAANLSAESSARITITYIYE